MTKASGRLDLPFTCSVNGVETAPTGTPTGVLVKNGTDLGTTVTVTMSTAQGIASCTIPSDAVDGDRFYLRVSAVVSGTTYTRSGPVETIVNSVSQTGDSYARIGAAGAGLTSVGDTRLVNLDASIASRLSTAGYTSPPAAATIAGQVRTELTTELGRIDAAVSSRLDASGVRTAIGLASANLDTQLSGISADADSTFSIVSEFADVDGNVDTTIRSWLGLASANLDLQLSTIDDYLDTEVSAIKTVTDRLNTALVVDGSVYQFTTNALENAPSGGGSSSVIVYPLNASMPLKSVGLLMTFYTEESGVVMGPIGVTGRSGNTIVPVDLSGRTLEVRFIDYLGTELLSVPDSDITISGTDNSQFEFVVTTEVTGTPTVDHEDQYHYWTLRDLTDGENVLLAGRARVLLS